MNKCILRSWPIHNKKDPEENQEQDQVRVQVQVQAQDLNLHPSWMETLRVLGHSKSIVMILLWLRVNLRISFSPVSVAVQAQLAVTPAKTQNPKPKTQNLFSSLNRCLPSLPVGSDTGAMEGTEE
ncbi:MAG: hypothetical protein E2O68_01170, partial [Deltaproteobacteria bacterium]